MSYPRTIRNVNVFVDGFGYFGRATEAVLPQLKLQTAAHRGAGMDAPIAVDMGMEAMTASASFKEWAPELVKHFGKKLSATFRAGAMGEEDFSADQWVFEIGGRVAAIEPDTLQPGQDAMLKLMWEVDYFRARREGEVLVEIDLETGKRIVGGEDQLAAMRQAMGI